MALTDHERAVLEFADRQYEYAGAREGDIIERFGFSAMVYGQQLNGLLDRPEALEYDPVLVNRLRRLREQRKWARSARALGINLQ